jgi:predicted HNH restriction endonuclease
MKCIVCGFDTAVVVHHIIPKADNGTNDPENLAVLCPNHHAMVHKNMISSEELTLIIKGIANNLNLPVSGS